MNFEEMCKKAYEEKRAIEEVEDKYKLLADHLQEIYEDKEKEV
jgi:hypothetical protein